MLQENISVKIEDSNKKILKTIAKKNNTTISKLIRQIIKHYIEEISKDMKI